MIFVQQLTQGRPSSNTKFATNYIIVKNNIIIKTLTEIVTNLVDGPFHLRSLRVSEGTNLFQYNPICILLISHPTILDTRLAA